MKIGTTLKADVNLVSDNEYLEDFPATFSGNFIDEIDNVDSKTETYLRSLAIASHSWEHYNVTAEGRYYQSLLRKIQCVSYGLYYFRSCLCSAYGYILQGEVEGKNVWLFRPPSGVDN